MEIHTCGILKNYSREMCLETKELQKNTNQHM